MSEWSNGRLLLHDATIPLKLPMTAALATTIMAEEFVHVTRNRRLTPEEAEHYRKLREQIEADLPTLLELGRKLKARKRQPQDRPSSE